MSEDKNQQAPPQQNPPDEEEKKKRESQVASAKSQAPVGQQSPPPAAGAQAQPTQPPAGQAKPAQSGPPPAPLPQRPGAPASAGTAATQATVAAKAAPGPAPAPLPARPPTARAPGPPAAVPPSRPQQRKNDSRRTFLQALVGVAVVLSIAPFVPWGQFLSSTLESSGTPTRQKVVIDNNSAYGIAAGKAVNVSDLTTFPPNSHWVITYPSSGDSTTDAQNPDTFVKFELIRLPIEMGGNSMAATDFVAFSKVCVHLWCSPNYNPEQCTNSSENGYPTTGTCTPHEQYECPCHGSIYRVPDGLAKEGPASQQPAPTNAIPMLTLTADPNGDLYIEVPVWDVDHNGVIGYGRNYVSYEDYIRPEAAGTSGGSSGSSSTSTSSSSTG